MKREYTESRTCNGFVPEPTVKFPAYGYVVCPFCEARVYAFKKSFYLSSAGIVCECEARVYNNEAVKEFGYKTRRKPTLKEFRKLDDRHKVLVCVSYLTSGSPLEVERLYNVRSGNVAGVVREWMRKEEIRYLVEEHRRDIGMGIELMNHIHG